MEDRTGLRLDRLRTGDWIIGVAAVALLVDLLGVPWYSLRSAFQATSAEFGAATSATGFQAHHILGPLLILSAVLGLVCWGLQAGRQGPGLPVVLTVLTAVITLLVSIAVLVRVVFDPPAVLVQGAPGVDTVRTDVGAVVGLFLSWMLFAGSWISLRTDGIADADAPRSIAMLRLTQRSP